MRVLQTASWVSRPSSVAANGAGSRRRSRSVRRPSGPVRKPENDESAVAPVRRPPILFRCPTRAYESGRWDSNPRRPAWEGGGRPRTERSSRQLSSEDVMFGEVDAEGVEPNSVRNGSQNGSQAPGEYGRSGPSTPQEQYLRLSRCPAVISDERQVLRPHGPRSQGTMDRTGVARWRNVERAS
jgi:hypothetical protein